MVSYLRLPRKAQLTRPHTTDIDARKAIRRSHENPAVQALYRDFLQGEPNSPKSHHLLHTHYTDRTAEVKGRTEVPFGLPASVVHTEPSTHC